MALTFVFRDGQRLTPYMLQQINRLDADFFAEFGYHIVVNSGIRTSQEQIDIFLNGFAPDGTHSDEEANSDEEVPTEE